MSAPHQDNAPHLTICFGGNGATCYVEGEMDLDCARRLKMLVDALHEHPARILCALKLCKDPDGGICD